MFDLTTGLGRFVCYEIAPVAAFDDRSCAPHLSMDDARKVSDSTFWSLYGVPPAGDVICIGDFCSYDAVAEVYTRITGKLAPPNLEGLRLFSLPAGF